MKKLSNRFVLPLFFFAALAVLVISLYSSSLMNNTIQMLEYNIEQRLLAVSKAAAQLVTGEELEQFQTVEDMDTPEYQALRMRLVDFSAENQVLYTYYMRRAEGQPGLLQHIIDNDLDPQWQVGLHSEPVAYEPAPLSALEGVAATSGVGDYSVDWEGLLAAYAPVYDSSGSITAIAGVDISDEQIISTKRSLDILNILQIVSLVAVVLCGVLGFNLYRHKAEQSDSANIAKSQFLSRMSHEIRTPMNAIIGLCRMAKETDDPDKINSYLDNIKTSSGHLLRLINDILDLSKIESGKVVLEIAPVNFPQELDSVRDMFLPQMEAKNQSFTYQLDPQLPAFVYCDSTHVKQILVNLLSNAVKFTPEEGEISLEVRSGGVRGDTHNFVFSVQDNGIGIDEQFLPRLFDPFEQGDGTTTRKYGGTGLGLAISRQLVEMMDGRIEVRSSARRGSEFTFNLWLREAPQSALPQPGLQPGRKVDFSGKTVLLVEDSDINQMIAEDLFRGMGAKTDIADNGLIGLQKFLNNPQKYDMIFMDVQMPVMDGYEATQKIRESKLPGADSIPIIAMTANVFKEDVEKALASGMNAHIGKPFEVEQVEDAILSVLKEN